LKIRNRSELLSHGNVRGRKIALKIAEYALKKLNGYDALREIIKIRDETLDIGVLELDLSKYSNIYVVGAGKASMGIAKALEQTLGNRIREGVIVVKEGQFEKLSRIEVVEAGHPLPNQSGFNASNRILQIADKATEKDLVFGIITGGSSALMARPVEGISLEDERKATELLLKCGATMFEMNAVRRHISATNGGRLAQRIQPAELINFLISDSIGDAPIMDPWKPRAFQGTPVGTDPTTFRDAVSVLKKYRLYEKFPQSIKSHLERGTPAMETPKSFDGMKIITFVLRNPADASRYAMQATQELGLNSIILSSMIEGESREAGAVLAGIAKESEKTSNPVGPPCVLVCAGETTVTIEEECGEGGPSQELALGFSTKINEKNNIVALALDTDGTDGPTDIAGGIVDGYTMCRAEDMGMDIHSALAQHNSSAVLRELDDAIFTGVTNTNVCDLNLIVILR